MRIEKSYDEIKMLHDSLAYMQQSLFDYVIKLHETTTTKERIESDKLYFIIGDVSGKGVPASLFMAIARSMFRSFSRHTDSPATIVSGMNNAISENNETNMFITLIVGGLGIFLIRSIMNEIS